ncbi:MAG: sensor domain-containing diguanylate cyclase [Deltaproteobacteria bacterium]|nr:sensor domain-containing diguanylate cyclase [Deltaproteobacteria bacterium]
MTEQSRTNKKLLEEISVLQQRIRELEKSESEQKQAEEALRASEERYRRIIEGITDYQYTVRIENGRAVETKHSPVCVAVTGYTAEEFAADPYLWIRMVAPEDRDLIIKRVEQILKGNDIPPIEHRLIRKDGELRWVSDNIILSRDDSGTLLSYDGVVKDITQRKKMEAEILALSITDQLTGLHNRRGFLSLAEQQLKLANRNKRGLLLFFADVDGLKWINDTLGHEEGDRALVEAAITLRETFRTSDIIARLGGDEFAILSVDITDANSEIFTTRLRDLIDKLNAQENRRYRLSISVGCSHYDPENPCSIDELMVRADKLMYEQKQSKKALLLQTPSPAAGSAVQIEPKQ